ncbi:T-complex protein 11-domain-containing protein [Clohesyomyces aquaticus]|uniref:T-complex protein 11-domain-containing protein n=1 Tax=Clohesyomyces aquaticus TaxID=1231657 RepID=A0A1Y1ZGG7_9PLEO|nr:T-complex protein 11-domain-containing protein [Clohesyomyces aquaticus]
MGAQGQKATASTCVSTDQCPSVCHQVTADEEGHAANIPTAGSACYSRPSSHDETHNTRHNRGVQEKRNSFAAGDDVWIACSADFPQHLADLIVHLIRERKEGEELADAFQHAPFFPPITKQSLSELDIQNIINNIKLRHDVNFDRDLSFRPNLDGEKGREKLLAAQKYWSALVAELELYARLFWGTPPLLNLHHQSELSQRAKRRIPLMFKTIKEVLQSLVPDRDQKRVEESLDVDILMQEIEMGVCDLPRLAEWLAHLLKEHCAPMRDVVVDSMVETMMKSARSAKDSSRLIVEGLRQLLGILETMKLDVANHQIKNLKVLLIEDTVNFERNYHLGRMVQGRGRINIGAAEQWYVAALKQFGQPCTPAPKSMMRFHHEVFARAVVSTLCSNVPSKVFPETFYLDHERLLALKIEIHNIIYFDICLDLFTQLLRAFKYRGRIPHSTHQLLRTSLSAIVGEERSDTSGSQWVHNCEHISHELLRRALEVTGNRQPFNHANVQAVTNALHTMFVDSHSFSTHTNTFSDILLPQILSCIHTHHNSTPHELFQALVAPTSTPSLPPPPPTPTTITSPSPSPTPLLPTSLSSSQPLAFSRNTPTVPLDQYQFTQYSQSQILDLANRISHITLLHWRTWGPIVYVLPETQRPEDVNGVGKPHTHTHAHMVPPPPPSPSPAATGVNVSVNADRSTGMNAGSGTTAGVDSTSPSPSTSAAVPVHVAGQAQIQTQAQTQTQGQGQGQSQETPFPGPPAPEARIYE